MVEQWSPKRAIPSSRGIQPSINLNNKKYLKCLYCRVKLKLLWYNIFSQIPS
jgi:hypothetical protein